MDGMGGTAMDAAEDVIDRLAGIAPGSGLDAVRRQRGEARSQAQASFAALFAPVEPGGFTVAERWAVAAFVARLHGQPDAARFYAEGLAASGAAPALCGAVGALAARGAGQGPFGSYPPGPLAPENSDGLVLRATAADRADLGGRLATALEHVHMLVFHPRDSAPPWLQALVDGGWTAGEIVTLSQLVAFLSFQIRVVLGLRALAPSM